MLNKIMLIGNLGKDPEMQVTAEGTPFTRFSLAVIANEMEMLSPKLVPSLVEAGENHDPFLPDLPEDLS